LANAFTRWKGPSMPSWPRRDAVVAIAYDQDEGKKDHDEFS
jgi:hypothetical protein